MLVALLSAFLGGLILNLMPCVFPVLSLKAAGLVRHGGDAAQARVEGVAFFVGVMATLLALAGVLIAARAGGMAIGWGFQLQSPLMIALLVLVMLGAALNLAGQFEVGMAAAGAGRGLSNRSGVVGAALTGALAIVVATPCTAPFMAGALGYALVQPPLPSLAIFAALGLGFAAPFTLLAMSPRFARALPKPGPWMETLKRFLAFPMFGAAAWLVWVLSGQTGQAGVAGILAAAVALAFAGWVYGIAQRRRMAGRSFRGLYAVSIVALVGAVVTAATLERETPAPGALAAADQPASATEQVWSPSRVAAAQAEGRPIFVNFTASWCIACQVNDKAALETRPFKEALARTGAVYMIADSTNYDATIEQALAEFGRAGLPLYLVYPADGGKPVELPQILTPAIVVDALEKAGRRDRMKRPVMTPPIG